MKKAPEKQELFLFSILALLVSLCHLSLIHSGQCILQNLRKVHMIDLRKCIQHSHLLFPLPHFTPIYYAAVWIFHRFPLYTQILMGIPKIFSSDLFWHPPAISIVLKNGNRLFFPSAHGFYPKKIEKRVSKSQTRLCKKKCAIVSYFRRKNKAEQLYKALDGGGVTIYQSKDCILKTLCDLQFLERSCRIKSWAEDASVCKSKPGGDSDFGILMRKESYGEPTDGEDRSAEGSKAIGQAKMMWTFLSKPAQGPIHVNPITPEKSNLTARFPAAWEGVPRR